MGQTYRDLVWTTMADDWGNRPALVARSESRGYVGYVAHQNPDGVWLCDCPAKAGQCWHVKEAPKALFYVQQRERFRAMGDDFAAFFATWWSRYSDATEGREYLGKSAGDWQVFYAALLDEQNERKAYTRKYVSQVKDIFSAAEVE